jgi:phytoene dehydrogenase-like protein
MAQVAIVGAGHNGLVAATVLARAGLSVTVIEAHTAVGGAARTEYPFARAPHLGTSSGAYLLGLMPPELLRWLDVRITLIRRDPHYFLPTLDRRFLLFGSDRDSLRRQVCEHFSDDDWQAHQALSEEIAQLRNDLAPGWLEEPRSAEETAERHIRPSLRRVFLDLVTGPVEAYLDRFGFRSPLLVAMYAVTDGFSGLHAGFGAAGTGLNFLVHNMCRLPGADGTWMIVQGGMGRVSEELARVAVAAGARIRTGTAVTAIRTRSGHVAGVTLAGGEPIDADIVLSNADPFRTRALVGADRFPASFNAMLDGFRRQGTTLKVNLALDRLPRFRCLPEDRGQHQATIHLLPQGGRVIDELQQSFVQAARGQLPDFPSIEWYTHTRADPSLQDDRGRHSAAFFVQWVPHTLADGSWDDAESQYVRHLIEIAERFAPGFGDGVADVFTLTPPKIAAHFGMTDGHIHHVDNSFGFDRRMPYVTPVTGLYACGAGCHPAGSVIGAAGFNSACRVLRDLDLPAPEVS